MLCIYIQGSKRENTRIARAQCGTKDKSRNFRIEQHKTIVCSGETCGFGGIFLLFPSICCFCVPFFSVFIFRICCSLLNNSKTEKKNSWNFSLTQPANVVIQSKEKLRINEHTSRQNKRQQSNKSKASTTKQNHKKNCAVIFMFFFHWDLGNERKIRAEGNVRCLLESMMPARFSSKWQRRAHHCSFHSYLLFAFEWTRIPHSFADFVFAMFAPACAICQ